MAIPPRVEVRNALRDLLCLLGATAVAWAFYIYARVLPTPALVAAWGLFGALIASALLYRARIRRRAFLAVYVASASPLQRWLRGGLWLALRSAILGALLALLLMVGLARIPDHRAWLLLIAAGPALVLSRSWALPRLAGHVSARYLPLTSWRVVSLPIGVLLMGSLVWLSLQQVYPDFAGVSLERAVWHMVDQEEARSTQGLTLLQAAAAKDGLRLWLAQQFLPAPAASLPQLFGWLLVFAEESLFAWSYLLLAHGVLTRAGAHDRDHD